MISAYLTAFTVSLAVSLIATPLVIRTAAALRLFDPRGARKVHMVPIPRIGGIALFLSLMAVAVPVVLFDDALWRIFTTEETGKMAVLLISSGFIFAVGILDDLLGLRALVKLAAQILAATGVCWFGIRIGSIPLLDNLQFGVMDWPVTIAWIVGITNAVNLIDGLDGLCAGICATACGVIATFAIYNGIISMAVLMLAMVGGLAGFLVFNFNPARIFMGDSGSMFLGFFLAVSGIICAAKVATLMGLILPALALGLPIFDMLLAVVRRVVDRRSIFAADKEHVHHRLIEKGLSHRTSVIILYLVTLLVAALGVLMMFLRGEGELPVLAIAILALLVLFRIVGVFRFRLMLARIQENLRRRMRVRRERKDLETLQDRFRAAWTLDQWWRAVRRMARRMGFSSVAVDIADETGGPPQTKTYNLPGVEDGGRTMRIDVPVEREDSPIKSVQIEVPLDQPLEDIGRKLSVFGRLFDEHTYCRKDSGDARGD